MITASQRESINRIKDWLCDVKGLDKSSDSVRLKFIWAGLVKEFCPKITYVEMAELAGVEHHSIPLEWVQAWYRLPFTTRHAWLEFFMGSDHKMFLMTVLASDPIFKYVKPTIKKTQTASMTRRRTESNETSLPLTD